MRSKNTIATTILLGFWLSAPVAAEEISSGLKVGERPEQFLVKDCTGPAAGKTLCYYCRYGHRPVVAVFVREFNDQLAPLVRRIDQMVQQHRSERLAALVVLVADDTKATEEGLKDFARRHRIKYTPLTIYRDQQTKLRDTLKLSSQAPVTLMMWRGGEVMVNRAFASPAVSDEQQESFLAEVEKRFARKASLPKALKGACRD